MGENSPDIGKESHADVISVARAAVGSYKPDLQPWTAEGISQRINDRLSKHEKLPLLEIYDFNADLMRAQAASIFSEAKGQPLNDKQEREVIAAQLRVTVLESLSGALSAYMDMMDQFQEYKNAGMRADPALEEIVLKHLNEVKKTAEQRSEIAQKLHLGQSDRKTLEKQALDSDNRMLQLLAAEDSSVPGANEKGILPAHSLILSMLSNQYNDTLKNYQLKADDNFAEIKKRLGKANEKLHEAALQKQGQVLTKEEAAVVLKSIDPNYTLDQYIQDLSALQDSKSSYEILKARGRANVQQLARLNDAIGRYQINRAELSSIRHHFDQAYKDSVEKPIPGQTSDAAMNASREFLDNQQKGSVGALERHLEMVDTGVLKNGIAEWTEETWNKNGRQFVIGLADQIATLETSWIPDLPFMQEGLVRNASKEYLISGLYDAIGWPRDDKGNVKEGKDLTDDEKRVIQRKQVSIQSAINKFRETGSLKKVQTSVSAAKMLISRKDLHAQNYLEAGEIEGETLPTETVTDTNIDALVKKYGAPTVYKMCFTQLQNNWSEYSGHYETLLTEFHDSIGAHYDFSRMMRSFADKQMGIAELLAGLGLAGWLLVAVGGITAAAAARYMLKHGGRLGWNMTKGSVKLAYKTGKFAVNSVVRTAGKTIEGLRGVKVRRVLGPLGLIILAADLRGVMMRDARLKELNEVDGINAALELMKEHGNKNALRYETELGFLQNRLEAWQMEHNAEIVAQALEKKFPEADPKIDALKIRAEDVRRLARKHKIEFENLFPVTRYLVTDPKRPKGNVGVNIRGIDQARVDGMKYGKDKWPERSSSLSSTFDKKPLNRSDQEKTLSDIPANQFEQILKKPKQGPVIDAEAYFSDTQKLYDALLEDAADALE